MHIKPYFTLLFFSISLVVFIFEQFLPLENLEFTPAYAFKKPWTFVTSIFLHADFIHLFYNMFALLLFGSHLEQKIKRKDYFILFFSTGIMGNLAYLLTDFNSNIPAVGASGAIYGIVGALAIIYPSLIVWVSAMPMPIIFLAIIWIVSNFVGLFVPSNIGYQAHLAGIFLGMVYGYIIKKKGTYFKD